MKTLLYSLMLMQMEAERDRPGEDSLPHRPAPPVLVGGRQPLIIYWKDLLNL